MQNRGAFNLLQNTTVSLFKLEKLNEATPLFDWGYLSGFVKEVESKNGS